MESIYRIVFAGDVGYTLIGEKAISIDELQDLYLHIHPSIRKKFINSLKSIFKGSKKFVLKTLSFDDGYEIELIHKKSLRALVSENRYVKKFIESNFSNEDEFYSKLEDPQVSVFDVVKNDVIIGLLFGYGEENARHFCRMYELGLYLKKIPYVVLFDTYMHNGKSIIRKNFPKYLVFPYITKTPELGFGFSSLDEEWMWLKHVDLDLSKENRAAPPFFITYITYM